MIKCLAPLSEIAELKDKSTFVVVVVVVVVVLLVVVVVGGGVVGNIFVRSLLIKKNTKKNYNHNF